LSALFLPPGVGPDLVDRVRERGVAIAGAIHPALKGKSIRVGHMGYCVTRPDLLRRTVSALAAALRDCGHPAADPARAEDALDRELAAPAR
nr:alanine--glyoxylate aminotransferase family protein [Acidobacteriota bacterium]